MKLTPEQATQFNRAGYLFLPGLFAADEVKTLPPLDLPWLNGMPASALVTSLDPIKSPQPQAA